MLRSDSQRGNCPKTDRRHYAGNGLGRKCWWLPGSLGCTGAAAPLQVRACAKAGAGLVALLATGSGRNSGRKIQDQRYKLWPEAEPGAGGRSSPR